MNPTLDRLLLDPPEILPPEEDSPILRPRAIHDLRGRRTGELRYPPTAAIVFAGIPGAGKSTALSHLFGPSTDPSPIHPGPGRPVVLDSLATRNAWRHRLAWLPYPLWRPLVHVAHYARIRAELYGHRGPVVIHDCATVGWKRRMLIRWSVRSGREPHLVLLDVPAAVARAGQHARGRKVGRISFRRHCFRWTRLVRRIESGREPAPRPASVVVLDRPGINRLRRIRFAA